jgi:hypothetical protein
MRGAGNEGEVSKLLDITSFYTSKRGKPYSLSS